MKNFAHPAHSSCLKLHNHLPSLCGSWQNNSSWKTHKGPIIGLPAPTFILDLIIAAQQYAHLATHISKHILHTHFVHIGGVLAVGKFGSVSGRNCRAYFTRYNCQAGYNCYLYIPWTKKDPSNIWAINFRSPEEVWEGGGGEAGKKGGISLKNLDHWITYAYRLSV